MGKMFESLKDSFGFACFLYEQPLQVSRENSEYYNKKGYAELFGKNSSSPASAKKALIYTSLSRTRTQRVSSNYHSKLLRWNFAEEFEFTNFE